MNDKLQVRIGQCTDKGRKKINQDFVGACTPNEPLLSSKGIAIALADGISSSHVSQVAAETAVSSFLDDYYCTSDAWSVKNAARKVLQATNSWLYSQTRNSPYRFERDKGYICTFCALILKSNTAHLFHCGDSRIYRIAGDALEPLTEDHRRRIDANTSYLTRALGVEYTLELDYQQLNLQEGDRFLLATDGLYEFASAAEITRIWQEHAADLNRAARAMVDLALTNGSDDNLSVQLLQVDSLPLRGMHEVQQQLHSLPLPPRLQPRMEFDGYKVLREIYISSRSHVFLAEDLETGAKVVVKTPSVEMRSQPEYLEHFLMEDWIARRIDNVHVLKAAERSRAKRYLYIATEYIEGQTLVQWMRDNPQPKLEIVRDIIEQVARGLQAFHRQEMIHQDLRPNNIMIDTEGTVKIIDFGATRVAGVAETQTPTNEIPGTAQFTAPEYFNGEAAGAYSDIFSLGVITYQMLSGDLPYGTSVAQAASGRARQNLQYRSMIPKRKGIPPWVDAAIAKSVQVKPAKRYRELSEFIMDLRRPNRQFLNQTKPPLIERDPIRFWQGLSLLLFVLLIVSLTKNL
ncbi:bifunctional protein-serine/threonine kinase/phosphatase [Gilvimarinus sp. DA14]|uniref:bifunctional protein-serine/threonine kinase/phosphatase n=1 Tax=Gilvimarinus sp. DA14 TaxID=2956798 RepID=UPI0020B6E9DF|nr:bifunctional protein-serine/threonine kinase/phosphatase [Gilvimarinus sp. DA14]UTF59532.1 protein kinase [Gilvimarinus sp. DA14]